MGQCNGKAFDQVLKEVQELEKQNLRICKVVHDDHAEFEVCNIEGSGIHVFRLETNISKKSEITKSANMFFVFLIKHLDMFDAILSILLIQTVGVDESMTTTLKDLMSHMRQVKAHITVKENYLVIKLHGEQSIVHLTIRKGYKKIDSEDNAECIALTKTFGIEPSEQHHTTQIMKTLVEFVNHADTIIQAIKDIIGNEDTASILKKCNSALDGDDKASGSMPLSRNDNPTCSESENIDGGSQMASGPAIDKKVNQGTTSKQCDSKSGTTRAETANKNPGITPKCAEPQRQKETNEQNSNSISPKRNDQTRNKKKGPGTAIPVSSPGNNQPPQKGKSRQVREQQDHLDTLPISVKQSSEDTCNKRKEELNIEEIISGYEKKLREIKIKNKDLKDQVQSIEKDNKTVHSKCNQLEQNVKDIESSKKRSEQEVKKIKQTKLQLENKNKEHESDISNLEKDLAQLKKEKNNLMGQNKNLNTEAKALKSDKMKLARDAQLFGQHYEELQATKSKLSGTIEELQIRLSDVTNRLAAEMNTKLSANETSLENISIKCRPMNIAEDFNSFVSNIWLDAKQALDEKKLIDETSIRFLCEILMISSAVARGVFNDGMSFLTNPFGAETLSKEKTKAIETDDKAPNKILAVIGDRFRRQADEIDIVPLKTKIIETIVAETKEQLPDLDKVLCIGRVNKYVEESARLAWKMAIQRPAMIFQQSDIGKPFKEEQINQLAWGSKPTKWAKVQYYQYPTLLHGEAVMVRGKVFVC